GWSSSGRTRVQWTRPTSRSPTPGCYTRRSGRTLRVKPVWAPSVPLLLLAVSTRRSTVIRSASTTTNPLPWGCRCARKMAPVTTSCRCAMTRWTATGRMSWLKREVPMANRRTRIDMSEVMAGFKKLEAAKEPIARAMGVAMGQEVRDEAKVRAPVLKPEDQGYDQQQPGTLRDAIYLAF